ncbi:MAG: hypothetical protein EOM74_04000, partial [Methanomicrobia archaeon]|nr:hypothetical protein [Methanomicrobia archaeon]
MTAFLNEELPFKTIEMIARAKKASVYLIGGFLRDHVLGENKKDFDFAVSSGALSIARSFAKKIKGAYVLLDKENRCARVVKKIKGEIYTFDFSDFRDTTLAKDLRKRDFTINTLAVDLSDCIG